MFKILTTTIWKLSRPGPTRWARHCRTHTSGSAHSIRVFILIRFNRATSHRGQTSSRSTGCLTLTFSPCSDTRNTLMHWTYGITRLVCFWSCLVDPKRLKRTGNRLVSAAQTVQLPQRIPCRRVIYCLRNIVNTIIRYNVNSLWREPRTTAAVPCVSYRARVDAVGPSYSVGRFRYRFSRTGPPDLCSRVLRRYDRFRSDPLNTRRIWMAAMCT